MKISYMVNPHKAAGLSLTIFLALWCVSGLAASGNKPAKANNKPEKVEEIKKLGESLKCEEGLVAVKIKIVTAPAGEAPKWVREAWIGLELPAYANVDSAAEKKGVVTGRLGSLGKIYIVETSIAIEILKKAHPKAAEWWEKNYLTPSLTLLGFPIESCVAL